MLEGNTLAAGGGGGICPGGPSNRTGGTLIEGNTVPVGGAGRMAGGPPTPLDGPDPIGADESGMGCGGSSICAGRFRTLISFRIRILMPWSASEHDSGVDSNQAL